MSGVRGIRISSTSVQILQRVLMTQLKYKPFKGLQFGGFILLVIGVFLGIGFNEAAGTGVALVGIVILWASRLLAWWTAR